MTTEDIKLKIKPGEKHWIKLKSGQVLKAKVTKVDSEKIYAEVYSDSFGLTTAYAYVDTFENLQKNATKIQVRKFDPYLTVVAIIIPVTIIGLAMLVYNGSYLLD